MRFFSWWSRKTASSGEGQITIREPDGRTEIALPDGRLFYSGGDIPCGEIPLPGLSGLCTLGKDEDDLRWTYLLAGLLVLRGMAGEARALGRDGAKSLLLDLLDARSAVEGLDRNRPMIEPFATRHQEEITAARARLHELFDEVLGRLALGDRWARLLIVTRGQAERVVDEAIREIRDGDKGSVSWVRDDLIEQIVSTPDWQDRALAAEHEGEGLYYQLAALHIQLRDICGVDRASASDLRNVYETLEGRKIAAEQHRAEMAAWALDLYDFVRRYRANDMSSDMEAVHHALVTSPSTAATEALAQEVLQERLDTQVRLELELSRDSVLTERERSRAATELLQCANDEIRALKGEIGALRRYLVAGVAVAIFLLGLGLSGFDIGSVPLVGAR